MAIRDDSMMVSAPLHHAYPEWPGCGGRIKATPEDFVVEELPAYLPGGTGEHLYLWVEKRGISTGALLQRLSELTGCKRNRIGHAGLKDSLGVTRQWVSLHMADDPPLAGHDGEAFRILRVARHGNKLRPGHLRGNRFHIRVREVSPRPALDAFLAALARRGCPNYFGPQRFGSRQDNAAAGRSLLLGEGGTRMAPDKRRFLVNAFQSALFNCVVDRRLSHGVAVDALLPGDLAMLHGSGGCFAVSEADLAAVLARAAAGELSATAPLPGAAVPWAQETPGAWEQAVMAEAQLTPEAFQGQRKRERFKGERRSVRMLPWDFSWQLESQAHGHDLLLSFALAPGQFATALLREIIKGEQDWP
jgi:tRNA pseudouridine13 synthase